MPLGVLAAGVTPVRAQPEKGGDCFLEAQPLHREACGARAHGAEGLGLDCSYRWLGGHPLGTLDVRDGRRCVGPTAAHPAACRVRQPRRRRQTRTPQHVEPAAVQAAAPHGCQLGAQGWEREVSGSKVLHAGPSKGRRSVGGQWLVICEPIWKGGLKPGECWQRHLSAQPGSPGPGDANLTAPHLDGLARAQCMLSGSKNLFHLCRRQNCQPLALLCRRCGGGPSSGGVERLAGDGAFAVDCCDRIICRHCGFSSSHQARGGCRPASREEPISCEPGSLQRPELWLTSNKARCRKYLECDCSCLKAWPGASAGCSAAPVGPPSQQAPKQYQ